MRTFLRGLALAAAMLAGFPSFAQIPPEALEKFRELPPDQQRAILQKAAQETGQPAAAVPLTEPQVVQPLAPEITKGKEVTKIAEGIAQEAPAAKLRPFGYDLFAGAPTTFAPATDIPITKDYVIGPGDVVEVQLFGKQNASYSLTVQRDGSIQLPEFGPIQVAGLKFDEMRQMLRERIATGMIGVQSAITLGPLRSIRVFVLGDARRPGSYTVSSLSTVTNALFVSGGISETGSLRRIQVKRRGELIGTVDLYDLLLRGDTSRDIRLEPGDVIFVPPVGPTAGISGEIRRPAIYEMEGPTTAMQLVSMAGGMIANSFPAAARLDRVDENNVKTILDLDLTGNKRHLALRDGDLLRIPSVLDRIEGVVFLNGHVQRPGGFKWRAGMRITDILPDPQDMLPIPDLDFGFIVREDPRERTLSTIPFTPRLAFADKGKAADLELQPRDRVFVFGLDGKRLGYISDVLDTLRLQARKTGIELAVTVQGNVQIPGTYPLFEGMRISDLIRASLNLDPDADTEYGMLVRENIVTGEIRMLAVRLEDIREGKAEPDLKLEPKDRLLVFSARGAREGLLEPFVARLRAQAKLNEPAKIVRATGHVRFPGTYPLTGEMSVTDLIGIAGGLSEPAYALSAEVARATADQQEGYSVTPLTVDLAMALDGKETFILQENDTLLIRRLPNFKAPETVTLSGEFRFPGEYRIRDGETLGQLIERAGGFTERAWPQATVFVRQALKRTESERLRGQKQQLEKDIARLQLQQAASGEENKNLAESLVFARAVADELSQVDAVGRMVVHLDKILAGKKEFDLRLEDGDHLTVHTRPESVSVFGEVLFPTSHQFQKDLAVSRYINSSGGTTQTADRDRTYVIRANGEIVAHAIDGWGWGAEVQPGDTVVVPYDADRLDKLKLSTNIVQIISQLAITAASLSAIGAF